MNFIIRKYLNTDPTKTLLYVDDISRLDYSDSLLYDISKELTIKLQRVQNTAARIVARTINYDHITPLLLIKSYKIG